jgi:hypothetical protein
MKLLCLIVFILKTVYEIPSDYGPVPINILGNPAVTCSVVDFLFL